MIAAIPCRFINARALASRIAENGRPAEVRIFLRDGALAGRYLHAPGDAAMRLAS
jgi:hypothetical protein